MTQETPQAQIIKHVSQPEDDGMLIVDLIAKRSSLSKSLIKKLMVFGAVFQTIKTTRKRVRKAKSIQKAGNLIECYFDPKINLDQEFQFKNLYETAHYGVYLKPAGAMTEGTNFGDRISLLRHVEKNRKFAHIVNRLDIETEGLVVIAYDPKTQNLLQQMWRKEVTKKYQAIVLGELEGEGEFDDQINNKFSQTNYKSVKIVDGQTYVDVTLATERKNQARIHFSDAGYPIMGDPKFGQHNKNRDGLKLVSYQLEFKDPYSDKEVVVTLPEDKLLF